MTTPASSATTPSPPLFAQHVAGPARSPSWPSQSSLPDDEKKMEMDKFVAQAELSRVTRNLRARLSYASYKAINNVPNASIRDLEAQSHAQASTTPYGRSNAVKRKAPGTTFYNNPPAMQSVGPSTSNLLRRGSSFGANAPPSGTQQARIPYLTVNGGAGPSMSGSEPSTGSRHHSQTLFTSILAPPPAKMARTILNAGDPPIAAPVRPAPSPLGGDDAKVSKSLAEGTRSHAKKRADGASPDRRRARQKRKRTAVVDGGGQEGDDDIKAAATLTSLLFNHRGSVGGSATSPRSSVDMSDTASQQSFSQYAQSSTRTVGTGSASSIGPGPPATGPAASGSASGSLSVPAGGEGAHRSSTPSNSRTGTPVESTTPRQSVAAPTDNEAADLMLFLATSPSPARQSNKEARDMAAFRALSGGGGALRRKGRVLFPSASANASEHAQREGDGTAAGTGSRTPRGSQGGPMPLTRSAEGSFNSSISSIGGDMSPPRRPAASVDTAPQAHPQLLPPPSLPNSTPSSPRYRTISSPKAAEGHGESVNRSPAGGPKGSQHGLRGDVGRKLFEEEQMRRASDEQRTLEAGIDLPMQG